MMDNARITFGLENETRRDAIIRASINSTPNYPNVLFHLSLEQNGAHIIRNTVSICLDKKRLSYRKCLKKLIARELSSLEKVSPFFSRRENLRINSAKVQSILEHVHACTSIRRDQSRSLREISLTRRSKNSTK